MEEQKDSVKKGALSVRIAIFFATVILVVMMFPRGESIESEVTVGSIWTDDDLIASMTFEVPESPEVYQKKIREAAESVAPVFVKKKEALAQSIDSLRKFKRRLVKILDSVIVNKSPANPTGFSRQTFEELKKLRLSKKLITVKLTGSLDDAFNISEELIRKILAKGLLDKLKDNIDKEKIAVREGKFEKLVNKNKFYDLESAKEYITRYLNNNFSFDLNLNKAVAELTLKFLTPNIVFSKALTDQEIEIAKSKVPKTKYIVNQDERIVAKHDRITKEIKEKIDAYHKAKGETNSFTDTLIQVIGEFLHITAIFSLFFIYIYLFRKKLFYDNLKILLISIIILFVSFITYLAGQVEVSAPIELLIFLPVASILFTIFFDSRIGFYGTVIVALTAGALRGNDYVFVLMNIVAGGLAVYSVRDVKNRSQIFRSFLFILVGYVVTAFAFGMESFEKIESILISSSFAASNALISPALAYGFIIFIEKIFKITTDLTYLELSDFNNPLLKELARNAPGTFNHSLTIGSMVEAAAVEIGANPTLARVGAYYHDIGKLSKPEAFVENQMGGKNIHEELNPRESAQMIIEHVKKGIELAEENNLPPEIIDFISMHHGTMVVSYFFEKAKELLGEEKVTEDEFRYPGPKPTTKETALVMLADAIESTVKAMDEPDPQKVKNVINNLVKMRIDDGQLDDSPMTFADIKKTKEAFFNYLMGQQYRRIRYPNQDEIESQSEEEKE